MLDWLNQVSYGEAYLLVIITMIFAMIAQHGVNSTFKKFSKIKSRNNVPASDIARQILDSNGLYNVEVVKTAGNLTDHYDPKSNVVALSESVYNNTSVAAIGIAAHECGHAVQHANGYVPVKIRTAIFPIVNFASSTWIYLFLIGLFLNFSIFTTFGIIFFSAVVIFQLVTLPVEFNASNRAIATISEQNILDYSEIGGAKKTLRAAALTYIASLAVSAAQLIRLIAQSNRRRN